MISRKLIVRTFWASEERGFLFLQQFITFRKGTYFKTFSATGNGKKERKEKGLLEDFKLFLK